MNAEKNIQTEDSSSNLFKIKHGLILVISCFVIISIAYLINNIFSFEFFSDVIALPLFVIIPGFLVTVSIITLIKSKKISELTKTSLLFMTLAFTFWFIAEQLWNIYENILDIDPYPSLADYFYISAPILLFFSLVFFLHPLRRKIQKKIIVFAIMVSIIILIPSLLATYNFVEEDDTFEIIIALIYPLVDGILLVPALIAALFSFQGKISIFWIFVLFGIFIFVTADTLFLFLIIDDVYSESHFVNILWLTSYGIWGLSMYYILYNSKNIIHTHLEHNSIETKYEMENINKFGILATLIIINIVTWILIYQINYSWNIGTNPNITIIVSCLFGFIILIFSVVIMYFNSKTNKLLETQNQKITDISEELIQSERYSIIGELSARLAHDMRNPLSVIQMTLENIKIMDTVNHIQVQQFDKIQRSIFRMTHQLDDVLGFVKKQPLRLRKTKISDVLSDSLDSIFVPDNITIKRPKNDVELLCDNNQISIVLSNIILNGIQAVNGNGIIEIRLKDGSDNIILEIIDSGPGIPIENIEKIFEPLFTTKQSGTGLGLASVKSIVEMHKGTISVISSPATFTLELPKV